MFRKLGIMWRSFKIKWIRGERNRKPLSYFNNYLFDWMFKYGGYEMLKKRKQIKYYKNGKTYYREFEDMNDKN